MPFCIYYFGDLINAIGSQRRIETTLAGIKIFVTGGIGGVHRNANETMDISADLTEMTQTSVAVVSAGIKSILDIGLTLEYLETKGIPVITIAQDAFPSFYSRKSGFNSPLRSDSGYGMPCAMIVDSSATRGLPSANAFITSGCISKKECINQDNILKRDLIISLGPGV